MCTGIVFPRANVCKEEIVCGSYKVSLGRFLGAKPFKRGLVIMSSISSCLQFFCSEKSLSMSKEGWEV